MGQQTRKKGTELFNDSPRGRPRVAGIGYGTAEKARASIRKIRKMPLAYRHQAATTMYYRAKYHAKQTADMRQSMKVWGRI